MSSGGCQNSAMDTCSGGAVGWTFAAQKGWYSANNSGNTYADVRVIVVSFHGTNGTTADRPEAGLDRLNGSVNLKNTRHPSVLWPMSMRATVEVALCTRSPAPYDVFRCVKSRSPALRVTFPASTNAAASTWGNSAQRDSALNDCMLLS